MTKHAADRVAEVPVAASAPSTGPATGPATAGEVLSEYLHTQAGDFLRSLRLHGESGADVEEAAEAARLLRRAARRISGALSVYRPITDTAWSDQLRAELAWLSGTLALEHAYAGRLARLRDALHRLSGAGDPPDRMAEGDAAAGEPAPTGVDPEAVGASGSTTSAARTARGGVTAGIDGPTGAAPRSSRTARRSVSLATGAPDPSARATRDEAAEAGGRTARARSAASGTPDGDTAARRPYEGHEAYEEWSDDTRPEGGGTGAAGANGTGPDGADAAWPVPEAGGDGAGARGPEAGAGRADRTSGRTGAEGGSTPGRGAGAGRVNRTGGRTAAHQRAGDAEEARGGALTVGAARAGALLERQLTLARTRAHTAALQALGSSRFHAVADTVALLASEVPLDEATAGRPAEQVLPPLAELANRRLIEAVEALPLGRAGHPYNAEALVHGLAATPAADSPPASDRQDAPWHQVRRLVRMRRYALEVLDLMAGAASAADGEPSQATRLQAAGQALERHRDAAEAAAAAAAAARTPRIAPATAYALGVLHADQRHEVEAARFAFGRMWRRVVGQAS
ncbi:CHAD domain-containing protein [Streptomyces sp. NPDC007983]|uniref:CHAD domain-containing protein n=1 Tax=Streptomyces sp. NPDC007983 TaxID=3364800 RepID=UPI0036F10C9A